MSVSADFEKEILDRATSALVEAGFRRRVRGIVTRPLTPPMQGFVGLNTAKHARDAALLINPVVGVRHDGVEQIVAEVWEEKPHKYIPPTVSMNVGYAGSLGDALEFEFPTADDPAERVAKLVATVLEYGVPFMDRSASLQRLTELLVGPGAFWDYASPRLLVIKFLLGEPHKSLESFVSDRIRAAHAEDLVVNWEDFEDFAHAFFEKLASESSRWQALGGRGPNAI